MPSPHSLADPPRVTPGLPRPRGSWSRSEGHGARTLGLEGEEILSHDLPPREELRTIRRRELPPLTIKGGARHPYEGEPTEAVAHLTDLCLWPLACWRGAALLVTAAAALHVAAAGQCESAYMRKVRCSWRQRQRCSWRALLPCRRRSRPHSRSPTCPMCSSG